MAVHDRPAAFEGSDGASYSVEILVDETGEPERPWGACLLFLRWKRRGEQGVEGHLESDWLAFGDSAAGARSALGELLLSSVKAELDQLIAAREGPPPRRWWDVMRDEGGDSA
jgi:hypothetical protein